MLYYLAHPGVCTTELLPQKWNLLLLKPYVLGSFMYLIQVKVICEEGLSVEEMHL